MYIELWLLATASIFTIVGYWMGRNAGLNRGVEMTLAVLLADKIIKYKTLPDGEEEIVPYNDKLTK